MKILFLAQHKWPHIGGVEKHVQKVSESLEKRGFDVKIISSEDIKYPRIKFLGLLYIWFWLFKNRRLILNADIIHCHDVFIWYLPFKFLYPNKKVITTIHGLEWNRPISISSKLQKKLAARYSTDIIGVGKFLEKYLDIKFDLITYGGA